MPSNDIIRPPSSAVVRACDGVDELIAHFLSKREAVHPSGEYEAPIEALNLVYLAIRDIEGVLVMARKDLVLLPPAMLAARAAFEVAALGAWLVNCEEPFERECRWLAHLRKEEEYYARLYRFENNEGPLSMVESLERLSLTQFAESVAKQLNARGLSVAKRPNFDQLLTSLGAGEMYRYYMTCSQFAHGTHFATRQFRRGIGGGKKFGEFTSADQWHLPLFLVCEAIARFGKIVLDSTGHGRNRFPSPEVLNRARKGVRKLDASDKISPH